jgi:hypothetical protein
MPRSEMRAWVISLQTVKRSGVIRVVSPYKGTGYIKEQLDALYEAMYLTLEEQAATFRRKNPYHPPSQAEEISHCLVTAIGYSGELIAAQKSTILQVREHEGRFFIKYRPDAFKRWRIDPKTFKPYVAAEVTPPVRESEQLDLGARKLLGF